MPDRIFSSKSSLSILHAHGPESRPALGRMSIALHSLETRYSRATVRHPVLSVRTGRCHIPYLYYYFCFSTNAHIATAGGSVLYYYEANFADLPTFPLIIS